jgi:hypothetical protein
LLLFSALLAFFLLSQAQAQQTVVRLQVDGSQPVKSGDTFRLIVLVDNVEHLAAFDVTVGYDPERLKPVPAAPTEGGATDLGEGRSPVAVVDEGKFLKENGERSNVVCSGGVGNDADNTVTVFCNTVDAPVCLGGGAGASGSGVLAGIEFKSKGGGPTALEITDSTLVLDDVSPCDAEDFSAVEIEHTREDATVELSGGGGGGYTVVIVVAVGVGVAAVIIALAGLAWRRRRSVSNLT